MQNKPLKVISLLELVVFSGLLIWLYPSICRKADFSVQALNEAHANWRSIIHLSSNAFFQWKYDWFSVWLEKILAQGKPDGSFGCLVSSSLIFTWGCFVYFLGLPLFSPLRAALTAISLELLIFYLFGSDTALLSTLAWFPWYLWSCCRAVAGLSSPLQPTRWLWYVTNFVFACILAQAALQFSILLIPLGFSLAQAQSPRQTPAAHNPNWLQRWQIFILLLPVLWVFCHIPSPSHPDYPQMAYVVPYPGVDAAIRPLLGPESPILYIHRGYFRQVFFGPSLIVLLILLLAFKNSQLKSSRHGALALRVALGLVSLVVLDSTPIEGLNQLAPLAVMSRTIPFLIFTPLTSLCFCLCLFISAQLIVSRSQVAVTSCAVFFLCALPLLDGRSFRAGVMLLPHADAAIEKWRGSGSSQQSVQILASPSYRLINSLGNWTLTQAQRSSQLHSLKLSREQIAFRAWPNSENADRIIDGNSSTRWNNSRGAQLGDEYFTFYLSSAHPLDGIEIDMGSFSSDFPRGVEIQITPACNSLDTIPESQWKTILIEPRWQGDLRYTERGYPYRGRRDQQRIIFPESTLVQCLKFKQIGKDSHYDWSVAELTLLSREKL